MKVMWAPWRMDYIKTVRKSSACIFCTKARQRRDATNLVLYRSQHAFVIMNLFPYNSGHLMVAPYHHVNSMEMLSPEASLDLVLLMNLSLKVLRAAIGPEGFNVGINLGRVSGAGIEEHVHVHIVPRWNGDTNFMPVFFETRVIPEHLHATYRKLRTRFRLLPNNDEWAVHRLPTAHRLPTLLKHKKAETRRRRTTELDVTDIRLPLSAQRIPGSRSPSRKRSVKDS